MTGREPLTDRQQRILDALRAHRAEHGVMPTAQQLAAAVGMRSTVRILDELGAIVIKGWLDAAGGQPCTG